MTQPEVVGELPPRLTEALQRLDWLVQSFQEHPEPLVQQRAIELLQNVDAVHRPGLRRLFELLEAAGLLRRALDDPETRLLFELYDLGEDSDKDRADAVLDAVRPYIESHGGRLEVTDAAGGVVTVRLSGACRSCAGSAATLRHVVEQTLRDALPDFERLEVLDPPPAPPSNFIPVSGLLRSERPRLVWHPVLRAGEMPQGGLRGIEVEGERVLIVDVQNELYAYGDACPGTPFPLHGGRVEDGEIVCPYHGCRFAARGGKRLNGQGPGLGVVPIAVQDGVVRIGLLEEKTQCA